MISRLTMLVLLVVQALFGPALPHVHCQGGCSGTAGGARPHVHFADHHHDDHTHIGTQEAAHEAATAVREIADDHSATDTVYLSDGTGDGRRRSAVTPGAGVTGGAAPAAHVAPRPVVLSRDTPRLEPSIRDGSPRSLRALVLRV